jgi:hypothetical protein
MQRHRLLGGEIVFLFRYWLIVERFVAAGVRSSLGSPTNGKVIPAGRGVYRSQSAHERLIANQWLGGVGAISEGMTWRVYLHTGVHTPESNKNR